MLNSYHDIRPFGQKRGAGVFHGLPVQGVVSNLSTNQPTSGKSTSMAIIILAVE